ncbi:MAG TPA: VWA domain-containing protein, partial [Nitrosarchaeum sp.]|nr:VWA domain-containing protein [Nitrosarchaeum sp.]
MQSLQLQNESLVEIATFLIRRWSERENITVEFSDRVNTKTRLQENRVILTPIEKRIGDEFQRYRQFRTSLWYESMRVKFCKKILSNDHAFGFILNTMETVRVEQIGRKLWKGMDEEIIFNYAYMLVGRPQLHTVYGKARIVEAFYQYFMFGTIKGE